MSARRRPPGPDLFDDPKAPKVYVDDMRAPFHGMTMCHMIADTEEALHAMADAIGLSRRWHQGDHYDVSLSLRALAVRNGAVEITFRQAGMMMANWRATGILGDPGTAHDVWRARRNARKIQP